jgi:hypothetical protein
MQDHPLGHCPQCNAAGNAQNRSTGERMCPNGHQYVPEEALNCKCVYEEYGGMQAQVAIPTSNVEEFRRYVIKELDAALGRSWFIRGDTRRLLSALRSRIPSVPAEELQKWIDVLPE